MTEDVKAKVLAAQAAQAGRPAEARPGFAARAVARETTTRAKPQPSAPRAIGDA